MPTITLVCPQPSEGELRLSLHGSDPIPESAQLLDVTFSDEELNRLSKFVEFADRLPEVWFKTAQTGMKIGGEVGKPVEIQTRVPDETDIDALVLRLRPFLHQNEPYFYNKIHKLLCWRFELQRFRQQAEKKHGAFNHPKLPLNVDVNGFDLTSVDGLDTWLYGDKYHFDDDKADRLTRWTETMGGGVLRVFFLQMLDVRIASIVWLANVARVLLQGFDDAGVTRGGSAEKSPT